MNPITPEDDMVPIGLAARMLGVSVETVRRWDEQGRITSTRSIGGQRRFTIAEVHRARDTTPAPAGRTA